MCEQQARDNHAQDGDLWNQCFIVGIDSKPCDGLKAKGHKCGQYQLALDELGNGFARKDEAKNLRLEYSVRNLFFSKALLPFILEAERFS